MYIPLATVPDYTYIKMSAIQIPNDSELSEDSGTDSEPEVCLNTQTIATPAMPTLLPAPNSHWSGSNPDHWRCHNAHGRRDPADQHLWIPARSNLSDATQFPMSRTSARIVQHHHKGEEGAEGQGESTKKREFETFVLLSVQDGELFFRPVLLGGRTSAGHAAEEGVGANVGTGMSIADLARTIGELDTQWALASEINKSSFKHARTIPYVSVSQRGNPAARRMRYIADQFAMSDCGVICGSTEDFGRLTDPDMDPAVSFVVGPETPRALPIAGSKSSDTDQPTVLVVGMRQGPSGGLMPVLRYKLPATSATGTRTTRTSYYLKNNHATFWERAKHAAQAVQRVSAKAASSAEISHDELRVVGLLGLELSQMQQLPHKEQVQRRSGAAQIAAIIALRSYVAQQGSGWQNDELFSVGRILQSYDTHDGRIAKGQVYLDLGAVFDEREGFDAVSVVADWLDKERQAQQCQSGGAEQAGQGTDE